MSNNNELIQRESREVAQQQTQQTNPMQLVELAINKDADIDKLERLMQMQERWEAREAEKAFNVALSDFQHKCPRIEKRKQAHNYKYAPLGDIIEQIKSTLHECGLSYTFQNVHDANGISVTCTITHVAGHSKSTSMTVNPDTSGSKNAIQAIGSAQTYGQRYTLIGALGITTADEDIDGRLPEQYKNKPEYKGFRQHRAKMLEEVKAGRSADSIIEALESDFKVSDVTKAEIKKLEAHNE
jgi:hypothetical protein